MLTEVTIYNASDHADEKLGKLTADQVRKVVVTDALVDTGATTLSIPKSLIDQLGLLKQYEKRTMTAGLCTINVYGTARLVIMGREVPTDVLEVSEGNPVLIGQIPWR